MKKHTETGTRGRMRRVVSAATALALAGAGLVAASPASAATQYIKDATFTWSVNDESTGGSYFGGCNFLVAGKAGDNGGATLWPSAEAAAKEKGLIHTNSDGELVDGNVSVLKSDGMAGTYANKCKTAGGTSVNGKTNAQAADNHTGDYVQITGGTGSIDPDTNSGTIAWKGSFTFAYYGGMTYWTVTDPKLVVTNGKGRVTGTYSGVGADMDHIDIWYPDLTKHPDYDKALFENGTIADIQNSTVDLTDRGASFTPDYLGAKTDRDGRNPQDDKSADNGSWWGSMPDAWVAFNQLTGQDSYWYTTAGAATSIQPRKKTNPVTITYARASEPTPTRTPTPSVKAGSVALSGTAKVGSKASAKVSGWTSGTKYSYQWLRGGKAIAKATGSSYTAVAADKGAKLSVKVTGTKAGHKSATKTSTAKTVAAGTITAGKVKVSGTAKVKKTLKAKVSSFKPGGLKYSYQWYANGKKIKGATKSSYKIAKKYKGKKLSVKVTAKKSGYTTKSKTSAKTKKVKK